MVFDTHWVLPDEIVFEDVDDALDRGGVAPAGGLADAGDASVGSDADDIAIAEQEGFDFVDFHFLLLRGLGGGHNLARMGYCAKLCLWGKGFLSVEGKDEFGDIVIA